MRLWLIYIVIVLILIPIIYWVKRLFFTSNSRKFDDVKNSVKELKFDESLISEYDDVSLAISCPDAVVPNQHFTIRFAAYPEQQEEKIKNLFEDLSPEAKNIFGIEYCQWKRDTEILVRLYSTHLIVEQEIQKFIWKGKHKILNFDVSVPEDTPVGKYITVKVDVLIADITIANLRLSLKIDVDGSGKEIFIKGKPYESAFASYAREDNDLVIGRLSEIERNGVKIFWDRLSLKPGEFWNNQLKTAIRDREIFLLFWSSNAKKSEWVEWEWRTALEYKGIEGIEPHPIEDPISAPPPDDLKALHFDDKYLYFKNRKN